MQNALLRGSSVVPGGFVAILLDHKQSRTIFFMARAVIMERRCALLLKQSGLTRAF